MLVRNSTEALALLTFEAFKIKRHRLHLQAAHYLKEAEEASTRDEMQTAGRKLSAVRGVLLGKRAG